MRRVLFVVRSLRETRLFSPTADFLRGVESYFLALRFDVYLWLKLRRKKVYYLGFGQRKGKVSKKRAFFNVAQRLKRGQKLNSKFWRSLAFRESRLKFFVNKIKPSLVVLWNGLYFEGRVLNSLSKCLFLENGFLPQSLQVDSAGVNACSSLKASLHSYLSKKDFHQSSSRQKVKKNTFSPPRLNLRELIGEWLFAPRGNRVLFLFSILKGLWRLFFWREKKLPNSFWLVILQQNLDSQLIFFSPYFKSKEDFAETVLAHLPAGDPVVVRPHPKDLGREDFATLSRLVKKRPNAFLSLKKPLGELLAKSKGVILINSGTAIEALSFLKPVFSLGKSFYDRLKIVQRLRPEQLKNIKPFVVCESEVEGLFSFLESYLTANDPKSLAQKIKSYLS